jgi:ferredoxin-NADP reductase
MLVKKYTAEVVSIANPVDALYLLELQSTGKPFAFLPGQFLHLALDEYDPGMGWPESRCFSIQARSGPGRIVLSFSAKGRFTRRMAAELAPGRQVAVKMPYGTLFQDAPAENRCVFVAGGTGITPFLSLFTDPSFAGYRNPVLYAGFRSREYNLYGEYLERGRQATGAFEYHIRYEDGEGMLDIGRIFAAQGADAVYYISGPPQMISAFRQQLELAGVAKGNVRTDDWE